MWSSILAVRGQKTEKVIRSFLKNSTNCQFGLSDHLGFYFRILQTNF